MFVVLRMQVLSCSSSMISFDMRAGTLLSFCFYFKFACLYVMLPSAACAITVLPRSPENLSVVEVTFNSVKLVWNSTCNTTVTSPIKSFVIQYRRNGSDDDHVEIPVLRPQVTVGSLNPDTAYEFHVFAVSDVGRSISAASTVVTTCHAGLADCHVLFIYFLLVNNVKCMPRHDRS